MFGLVSKRKIARVLAETCNKIEENECGANATKEQRIAGWAQQSTLNYICTKLKVKPAHMNELGGGTGKMLHKK